jgi:ABC-type uncharacterized transport system involved in gliding motility auxiliary subunit
MASGAQLNPQFPRATAHEPVWNAFLERYGVKIRPDMVYDLAGNLLVPVPSAAGQVLAPYPLWVRAQATGASVVTEGVGEALLPWASSVDTTGARRGTVTPLLVSSRSSGLVEGEIDINPTRQWPQYDLKPRIMALQVNPRAGGDTTASPGRVVVVGNSDVASDRAAQQAPENLALALNAVDWLSQDESLIAIRSRDRRPPPLVFSSAALQQGVKYGNLILVPLLLAGWAVLRLTRRRRRALDPWRPLAGGTAGTGTGPVAAEGAGAGGGAA